MCSGLSRSITSTAVSRNGSNCMATAYYSVISPEACSAILWKDRKHAAEAAEALKLTADDLMKLGVVDEVVPEPEGGAHRDHDLAAAHLGSAVRRNLERLTALSV